MFSDIGKKLMSLGVVLAWATFFACMLWFLVLLAEENINCIYFFLGAFASFPAAWPLYGFGQLIDDIHAIRNRDTDPVVGDDELPRL